MGRSTVESRQVSADDIATAIVMVLGRPEVKKFVGETLAEVVWGLNRVRNAKQTTTDDDRLMTREQLAVYLQVSVETIATWKSTGARQVPEVDMGGRLIRYRKSEINEWLAGGVKFEPVG